MTPTVNLKYNFKFTVGIMNRSHHLLWAFRQNSTVPEVRISCKIGEVVDFFM